MKKIVLLLVSLLVITGCSAVRINTRSIDNILNVILTKNNSLFNQVGQGYKYYLPGGVTYIASDDLNDILYCNGTYYYLYIDAINYYYKEEPKYEKEDIYYSKKISKKDGFKSSGYLKIYKIDNEYYMKFVYNHARIEAIVKKEDLNNTVLNSTYILSTIKYNKNIVKLMLNEDYFTNKTGKYDTYKSKQQSGKFELQKESKTKEG